MRFLSGLPNLRELSLIGSAVTDQGIKALDELPSLRTMKLEKTAIGNESMSHIARFPRLSYLDIRGTAVSAAGFASLRKLKQLTELHIGSKGPDVTNDGLEFLAEIDSLRSLNISYSRVTHTGLAHLRDKPLETLSLYRLAATDRAIDHILTMKSLWQLKTRESKITTAGILRLKDHPTLRELTYIPKHGLSLQEAATLSQRLPGLLIDSQHGRYKAGKKVAK